MIHCMKNWTTWMRQLKSINKNTEYQCKLKKGKSIETNKFNWSTISTNGTNINNCHIPYSRQAFLTKKKKASLWLWDEWQQYKRTFFAFCVFTAVRLLIRFMGGWIPRILCCFILLKKTSGSQICHALIHIE